MAKIAINIKISNGLVKEVKENTTVDAYTHISIRLRSLKLFPKPQVFFSNIAFSEKLSTFIFKMV